MNAGCRIRKSAMVPRMTPRAEIDMIRAEWTPASRANLKRRRKNSLPLSISSNSGDRSEASGSKIVRPAASHR